MSEHVAPVRTYFTIYFILMGLLVATVGVAYVPLGDANLPVALLIASVKASLIILFFMHVKDATKLTWVFSSASFIWLGIMLTLTMMDFLSRNWLDIIGK